VLLVEIIFFSCCLYLFFHNVRCFLSSLGQPYSVFPMKLYVSSFFLLVKSLYTARNEERIAKFLFWFWFIQKKRTFFTLSGEVHAGDFL